MSLVVRRIEDFRQARCAYLVGCVRSGEAVIIDPERDVDRCIEAAAREGLRVAAVAETRVHADFLSGARELAERTGAVVLVSAEGGPARTPRWVSRYANRLMRDGDIFDVGGVRLRAMHLPGMTPEQLVYLVFDRASGAEEPCGALVGDFLSGEGFAQAYSEIHAGSAVAAAAMAQAETLRLSMMRLLHLPEWLQLWPLRPVRSTVAPAGGLPQTSIGYERRFGRLGALVEDAGAFVDAVFEGRRGCDGCQARVQATNIEGVPLLARMPQPQVLESLDEHPELLDPAICTVVDTRAWSVFRSGHLPGAIHAPMGRGLARTVGVYVEPDERVVLVCDPGHAGELVRECVRVGIDRVEAVLPPALLHQHRERLQMAPEAGVDAAMLAITAGDVQVIDVRSDAECRRGMIPGARHVPPDELVRTAPELRDAKVVVHCALGGQSATAVSVLRRHGVDAVNLAGGIEAWKRAGHPTVIPGGYVVEPGEAADAASVLRARTA